MRDIPNDCLLEAHDIAKESDCDQHFLLLLETEIFRRIEHTLNNLAEHH